VDKIGECPLGFEHALLGGFLEPGGSVGLVGFAPLTFGKHDGKVVLRERMAALGSLLVPGYGLRQVPWHTLGGAKHDRKLKLRWGVIAVGGFLNPVCRRIQVLRNAPPIEIQHAERMLSLDIPTLGRLSVPANRVARFGLDRVLAGIEMS
jgi:hypothetical protein